MKQLYYQDGCLSQEDMYRYKTKKQNFATRRLVYKHIRSCQICSYLYQQTPSTGILQKTAAIIYTLPNIILELTFSMRRSTRIYAAIILFSLILTPLVLIATFKNSGLKFKATKEIPYNVAAK